MYYRACSSQSQIGTHRSGAPSEGRSKWQHSDRNKPLWMESEGWQHSTGIGGSGGTSTRIEHSSAGTSANVFS